MTSSIDSFMSVFIFDFILDSTGSRSLNWVAISVAGGSATALPEVAVAGGVAGAFAGIWSPSVQSPPASSACLRTK